MKKIEEMSFREQIGAASKYGAYGSGFVEHGFRALDVDGQAIDVSPAEFQAVVDSLSEKEVGSLVQTLGESQPNVSLLAGWGEDDLLKLRAHLALRLGYAKRWDEYRKNLALTRSYIRPTRHLATGASPYRDGSPGQTLSRREREQLFDALAERLQAHLSRGEVQDAPSNGLEDAMSAVDSEDEALLIKSIHERYTFPATVGETVRVTKTVVVKALRDGVTEYRNSVHDIGRGLGAPDPELIGGPAIRLERFYAIGRGGVGGYEYQVVIPFQTPMGRGEVRELAWTIRSPVDDAYFHVGKSRRRVGFHFSRRVLRARIDLQFPPSASPRLLAVNSNVRLEDAERYDEGGDIRIPIDGYAEVEWPNPRVGKFCTVVWPR